MKCIVTRSIMLAILLGTTPVFAAKGGVSYIKSGCGYYIVETNMGFALLEWFGGSTPSRGDVAVGDYESYGMKDIYNLTQDSETKVWVDNFWLSKDRAIERYFEKCN
jgi:hypothetical protein